MGRLFMPIIISSGNVIKVTNSHIGIEFSYGPDREGQVSLHHFEF